MSIKVVGWALEQQVEMAPSKRLLIIGLANHAHDDGTKAFPSAETLGKYSGLTVRHVRRLLAEMERAGIIRRGEQAFAAKHIDRADRRPVVWDIAAYQNGVTSAPRGDICAERGDTTAHDGVTSETERGDAHVTRTVIEPSVEPSGIEPSYSTELALVTEQVGAELSCKQDDPVQTVFDAWIQATGRTGRTRLDAKRRRVIKKALKEYPLEDVLAAVRGWQHDPFYRGETSRDGKPVNHLDLLLRDAEHIEKFRDMALTPTTPNLSQGFRTVAAWAQKQGVEA